MYDFTHPHYTAFILAPFLAARRLAYVAYPAGLSGTVTLCN